MNRRQFMQQLSQLLMDLPNDERFDALKYYNNYFDDAGEENEGKIIEELGSPEAVAAVIKADMQNNISVNSDINSDTDNKSKKKWSTGTKIGIVILCILASPMIIALGCVALGIGVSLVAVAASVVVAIFGVFIAASASGIGCVLGGLGMFGLGIYRSMSNVANGLVISGGGFIITAVGILLCIVSVLAWTKATPAICRWIGRSCKKLFSRRQKA